MMLLQTMSKRYNIDSNKYEQYRLDQLQCISQKYAIFYDIIEGMADLSYRSDKPTPFKLIKQYVEDLSIQHKLLDVDTTPAMVPLQSLEREIQDSMLKDWLINLRGYITSDDHEDLIKFYTPMKSVQQKML